MKTNNLLNEKIIDIVQLSDKNDNSVSNSAVIRSGLSSVRNGDIMVYVPFDWDQKAINSFISEHCMDKGDALGNKPFYSIQFIRTRLPSTIEEVTVTDKDRELIEDINPKTITELEKISKKIFNSRSFTTIAKSAGIIVKKYNIIKAGTSDGYDKNQQKELDRKYENDINGYLAKEDLAATISVRHLTLHPKMPNKAFSGLSIPSIKYVGFDKLLYKEYRDTLTKLRSSRDTSKNKGTKSKIIGPKNKSVKIKN